MDIIPTIPAGITALLALFAPFLQAVIQRPKWRPWVKRTLAVVLAVLVAAAAILIYYARTGEVVPQWPTLILLAFVVAQAVWALMWKTAQKVERSITIGPNTLRRDLR